MLPQQLEQLGIPPSLGSATVKLPRVLTALKDGEDKAELLSVVFAMIANGVLPQEGQKRAWKNPDLTQDMLAKAVGLESRASLTKRLAWLRGQARDKSGNLKPGNVLLPLLESERRWARPNKYDYTDTLTEKKTTQWVVYRISTGKSVPRAQFGGPNPDKAYQRALERAKELNKRLHKHDYAVRSKVLDPDCFWFPSADDIVADPELSKLFDHELLFNKAGERSFSGDADIPVWIWHPSMGLSDTARLVLTYYWMCGLGTLKDSQGKVKGWIQPKQSTVARRLGISTKTVHAADIELGCADEVQWVVYRISSGKAVKKFGDRDDPEKARIQALAHAEKLKERRKREYGVRPYRNAGKPYSIGLIRVVGTIHSNAELRAKLNAARAVAGKEGAEPVPEQFRQEWRRENIILFLPIRTMTDQEIWAERRRMMYARKALHAQRQAARRRRREMQLAAAESAQYRRALALQCCKAARIHRKVVESFKGQTARVSRIWAAVTAELLSAGIDRRLIAALVPIVHDPPPPPDPQKTGEIREMIFNSLESAYAANPKNKALRSALQAKLELDRRKAAEQN